MGAVVQLGSVRRLVGGDLLGVLDDASVLQVAHDPRGPEGVGAPRLHAHLLRHTFAANLINGGDVMTL
jgi:integrase